MNKKIKGIILMIVVVLAAVQHPPIIWAATILASILVGVGYYTKNYLMPSKSLEGDLGWRDILSSLILAVVAALSDSISSIVVNGVILWPLFWNTIVNVVAAYLTATTFSGRQKDDPPPTTVPPEVK